jgi:hypothetical protein
LAGRVFPANDPIAKMMKPGSDTSSLAALRAGETALALLEGGCRGRLLAAFSSAIYLDCGRDELCWLVGGEAPMHRRALYAEKLPPQATAEMAFEALGGLLRFDNGLALDFSQALPWAPPRLAPEDAAPISDVSSRLPAIVRLWESDSPPPGFGFLVPYIGLALQGCLPASCTAEGTIQRSAWPHLREIIQACLHHDLPRLLEYAKGLIGLGEGLTPSGDDFVGGVLFSLAVLQDTYGLAADGTAEREQFLAWAKPRTNIISYTLLKEHAGGNACAPLSHLVHAMLCGQNMERIRQCGAKSVRLGHSTGWDLLAGALTGLLLVVGANPQSADFACTHSSQHLSGERERWFS